MKMKKLTRIQAEKVWIHEHTRNGERIIPSLLRRMPCSEGAERLLHTGAKLYRTTRGFFIGGYSPDGSDVDRVLEAVGIPS